MMEPLTCENCDTDVTLADRDGRIVAVCDCVDVPPVRIELLPENWNNSPVESETVTDGSGFEKASQKDPVKREVARLDGEHEPAAPVGMVIQRAKTKHGLRTEDAEERVAELKRKGEIYSPADGFLRVT